MTIPGQPLDPTRSERDERVLGLPLNKELGLTFDGRSKEGTYAHFAVTEPLMAFGGVHGGALYALLDVVCMLSLLPLLGKSEVAVTHDLHISMMRSVPLGSTVTLHGNVVRRGKQIAFVEGRAECDGKLVAAAHVTKSIVNDPAARAATPGTPAAPHT